MRTEMPATVVIAGLLCSILALLSSSPVQAAKDCTNEDRAESSLDVWDRPPTYSTSSGWTSGSKIATLSAGTPFRVCDDKHVGFFFSREKWLRILWDGREGWVQAPKRGSELLDRYRAFSVSRVFAKDSMPSSRGLFDPLLLGSFLSMILGMVGKNMYDLWRDRGLVRGIVSHIVPALIVSPMVFLGFIKSVDLAVASEGGMLVLFLFAFQNGFFWQDILGNRVAASATSPRAAGSPS